MISEADLAMFRKQFDMNGETNDEELFMALARERLRLRTKKKSCENNPVSKSICVNKETPLPQEVIGKVISRSIIGYKKGIYVGKIGIAMLTTPLGQKFIIFKEVKGYTKISTLKRLSIWCFNAKQPLKFHRNCKNFYIREPESIWWRLSFRTDTELEPLLDLVDGVNIKLINKMPTNMEAQVEETKLISKITNPSIEDPRLRKMAKKAAKAVKKLKLKDKEAEITQVEADSTQILHAEKHVQPARAIGGNSEAEVKIEPDLRPHALIGPEVKAKTKEKLIKKKKEAKIKKNKKKSPEQSPKMPVETEDLPSTQNFFGKEGSQQSNRPHSLKPRNTKGSRNFLGFLNYVCQLQNFPKMSMTDKMFHLRGSEFKKFCLLLQTGLGNGKLLNLCNVPVIAGDEQKTAILCEFLKRLMASQQEKNIQYLMKNLKI